MLCPQEILGVACFMTALCDPCARVGGLAWGKTQWWFSKKTCMGSSICWLVATVIAFTSLLCLGTMPLAYSIFASIVAGAVAALVELVPQFPREPKPGDILSPADNFSIILATSVALCLCHPAYVHGLIPI